MLPSPQNLCLTLWLYIWLYMVILLYRFLIFEFLIIWRNNQFQCKWTKRLGCSFSLQIIVSWFPTELANVFKRLIAWRLVCIFFSLGESFFLQLRMYGNLSLPIDKNVLFRMQILFSLTHQKVKMFDQFEIWKPGAMVSKNNLVYGKYTIKFLSSTTEVIFHLKQLLI